MRVADFVSVALLVFALFAFLAGVYTLGEKQELYSVYWLLVGALSLRAATNVLRPRGGAR